MPLSLVQPLDPAVDVVPIPSPVRRLYLVLLSLIALAYCIWVLSLPLFPTQDGPMHLYFMHVLESVLRHPDGFYGHFYFVRHVLPPYALYYYLLMALGAEFPVLLADKIVICLYIVSFCFGFRYLARAIGPNGDVMALLATVLLLNWPLGMGFVNFCLSTSFALWALGLWCRFAVQRNQSQTWRRRVLFVVFCYIIMFTHPVPLLAVGGFALLELALRGWRGRRTSPASGFFLASWGADAVTLLLGMGTLAYVRLFTTGHMLHQVHLSTQSPLRHELSLMKGYVLLHSLTAFAGRGAADGVYRGLIYMLLAGSLIVAVRQWRANRKRLAVTRAMPPQAAPQMSIANTWALAAVALLLVFPFVPEDLNNSAYFAARLSLFVWLVALLAASGARLRRPSTGLALAGVSTLATALILGLAHSRINPIAEDIASIERMPAIPEHTVGLLLHSPAYGIPATITYDPYFWSGARMFRRTDSVMYNTPWLDLAIIPLGPASVMPTYQLSPNVLESPPILRTTMDGSAAVRNALLEHVDLVLVSSGERVTGGRVDPLLTDAVATWNCQPEGKYSVCMHRGLPR